MSLNSTSKNARRAAAARLSLVLAALALPGGCVAEKSLGDPEATDGAEGSGTDATAPTGTPGSMTNASSTTPDSQTTDTPTQGDSETDGDTDVGDTDTLTPGMCGDYAPPPIECEPAGEGQASFLGEWTDDQTDTPCTVTAVETDDTDGETITLDCGFGPILVGYTSAPYLAAPVAANDQVLFSFQDYEESPNLEASFSLSSPEGELLLAFLTYTNIGSEPLLDLGDIEVAFAGTGCFGVEVPAALCERDDQSIVSARVDVDVTLGDEQLFLSQGGSGTLTSGPMNYGVGVGHADRIVCWDDGCAGDESGPYDFVELLIVAQP